MGNKETKPLEIDATDPINNKSAQHRLYEENNNYDQKDMLNEIQKQVDLLNNSFEGYNKLKDLVYVMTDDINNDEKGLQNNPEWTRHQEEVRRLLDSARNDIDKMIGYERNGMRQQYVSLKREARRKLKQAAEQYPKLEKQLQSMQGLTDAELRRRAKKLKILGREYKECKAKLENKNNERGGSDTANYAVNNLLNEEKNNYNYAEKDVLNDISKYVDLLNNSVGGYDKLKDLVCDIKNDQKGLGNNTIENKQRMDQLYEIKAIISNKQQLLQHRIDSFLDRDNNNLIYDEKEITDIEAITNNVDNVKRVKEGWTNKKSKYLGIMKKRWTVIEKRNTDWTVNTYKEYKIYENATEIIEIDKSVIVEAKNLSDDEFIIYDEISKTKFEFKAESSKERDAWLKILKIKCKTK